MTQETAEKPSISQEVGEVLTSQNVILRHALNTVQRALFKHEQPAGISKRELILVLEQTENFFLQFIGLNMQTIQAINPPSTEEGEPTNGTEKPLEEGTQQPVG